MTTSESPSPAPAGAHDPAAAAHIELLSTLIRDAQQLSGTLPISKDAYVAWRVQADTALFTCFGPNSITASQVHQRGILPTSFFGSTFGDIQTRIGAERKARLLDMKLVIEGALERYAKFPAPVPLVPLTPQPEA